MLRMKNVLRPRSVSDTDLCTYIHRAPRLPHSLSRIKRSVSTFFFLLSCIVSDLCRAFAIDIDGLRWFANRILSILTISQSKSINNVKISRIWMGKKAVISPRIFMQIYTFTSAAVKVESEQKFVLLA